MPFVFALGWRERVGVQNLRVSGPDFLRRGMVQGTRYLAIDTECCAWGWPKDSLAGGWICRVGKGGLVERMYGWRRCG